MTRNQIPEDALSFVQLSLQSYGETTLKTKPSSLVEEFCLRGPSGLELVIEAHNFRCDAGRLSWQVSTWLGELATLEDHAALLDHLQSLGRYPNYATITVFDFRRILAEFGYIEDTTHVPDARVTL